MEGTGAYGVGVRTTQRKALGFAAIRNVLPRSTQLAAHNRAANPGRLSPRSRMVLSEGSPAPYASCRAVCAKAPRVKWRSRCLPG